MPNFEVEENVAYNNLDFNILENDTMYSCPFIPTFRRIMLIPSSVFKLYC